MRSVERCHCAKQPALVLLRLLPLLLALALLGCYTTTEETEYSQGQIVSHAVDEVWVATRSTMRGLGRGEKQFDEQTHEAVAVIGGEKVTVRIEAHSFRRTIVRVITKDVTVAQEVLQAITSLLPLGR